MLRPRDWGPRPLAEDVAAVWPPGRARLPACLCVSACVPAWWDRSSTCAMRRSTLRCRSSVEVRCVTVYPHLVAAPLLAAFLAAAAARWLLRKRCADENRVS